MARIVGITAELTKNMVILDSGEKINVHCGADILLTGLYQNVKGEAICPVCKDATSVAIEDHRIKSASPSSALLHYVVEDERRFSICCNDTFIFDKKSCLSDWLKSYEGKTGRVSALSEFIEEAISHKERSKTSSVSSSTNNDINLKKDHILQELADELLDEMGSEMFNQIVEVAGLVAEEGHPVPVTEAAKTLRMSLEETRAFLAKAGAEFDEKGNLVGLGITLIPTPHLFEMKGKKLYTWCAGDTMIFPMALGQTANVQSSDPISGEKISLITSLRGVERIEPSSAVLTWPTYPDLNEIRESVCSVSHFFASRETAEKYASKRKGVTILTPEDVRQIFKVVAEKIEIEKQDEN